MCYSLIGSVTTKFEAIEYYSNNMNLVLCSPLRG